MGYLYHMCFMHFAVTNEVIKITSGDKPWPWIFHCARYNVYHICCMRFVVRDRAVGKNCSVDKGTFLYYIIICDFKNLVPPGHKQLWWPLAANKGFCDFKDVVVPVYR